MYARSREGAQKILVLLVTASRGRRAKGHSFYVKKKALYSILMLLVVASRKRRSIAH